MTLPATAAATGGSISFSGDNRGTLIIDNETPSQCYQKTNYRGEPHEWGAYGDAVIGVTLNLSAHDDTVPMQNWLGAYGNLSSLAPATAPNNFGPWNATIPGTYLVTSPLFCPANATIFGPENLTNAGNASGNNSQNNDTPRVNILASDGSITGIPAFSGTTYYDNSGGSTQGTSAQGIIGAQDYCRLSGIAVTGTAHSAPTTNSSTTSASNLITVPAVPSWLQIGNVVADAISFPSFGLGYIPAETTVIAPLPTGSCSPCTVYMSQNATNTSSSTDTITFYGPDTVDILGTHVTIDGFSLLSSGHYDIFCGIETGLGGELAVKDSYIKGALLDDLHIPGPCSNSVFTNDIVATAGGDGFLFGGTESDIEGGVIEGANGVGLHFVPGADRVTVSGVHIQGNGGNNIGGGASAGVVFDGVNTISFCNNHLEGNGGDVVSGSPPSSQVYFADTINNVTLCGNVYETENFGGTADVFPFHVYDAATILASRPTITNSHIYETAAQPAISVFEPLAQSVLQPLTVPQFTQNQISGLTLSNAAPFSKQVVIAPGAAADSTNSTLIQLTSPCTVGLGTDGPGGLDVGRVISLAQYTTYYIFVIAAAAANPSSGAPSPTCMASTSLIPSFTDPAFNNTGYQVAATGGTLSGGTTVYNPAPLAGVIVGDAITSPSLPTSSITTISGFSANAEPSSPLTSTASWTGAGTTLDTTIYLSCSPNCNTINIQLGMAVQAQGGCIPSGVFVDGVTGSSIAARGIPTTCSGPSGGNIYISGARQLVLSQGATVTNSQAALTISTGYYRLIGAVMTDGSKTVVPFMQDDDTFYLATPVLDIPVTGGCNAGGGSLVACALSVPCGRNAVCAATQGVHVEAFGRILGGGGAGSTNRMLITSINPTTPPGSPHPLSVAPGYSAVNPSGDTAFPFRLYTDLSPARTSYGSVNVQTNNTSNVYEITDGWVFHR